MSKEDFVDDSAFALLAQKNQLDKTGSNINQAQNLLDELEINIASNDIDLDNLLEEAESLLSEEKLSFNDINSSLELTEDELSLFNLSDSEMKEIDEKLPSVSLIDTIDIADDWDSYMSQVNVYAQKNEIDFSVDPFLSLLSQEQRATIENRLNEDYKFKNANCDKYDYMIAATCGTIGGLIDALFLGLPGQGIIGKFTDGQADKAVEKFAKAFGWDNSKAINRGSNTTKSAIGFLEGKFKVNYDQAATNGKNGTGGSVKNMYPLNHHLKSLAHSPSPIGLFCSILNQLTSTSTFISNGSIITIDTENFELQGSNLISKIFAGFVNWLGHLFSDLAGSSGASGRGSGVPIPFYELLQLANFGSFGQNKQTFATIAVKVFEQGYDLRHGAAMAVPVLTTELSIRIMWSMKAHFYHKLAWKDSIPVGNNPELRRMLLVGHGCLCLVDITDAAIRSGGEPVQMLLRTNIIGWVRFGHLGIKEARALFKSKSLDIALMDDDLDKEMDILYRQIVA